MRAASHRIGAARAHASIFLCTQGSTRPLRDRPGNGPFTMIGESAALAAAATPTAAAPAGAPRDALAFA